ELFFDNVEVPESAVLGEVGKGFQMALGTIVGGRVKVPSYSVGHAQRLLEMAIDYAKQRQTFGRPIADYQAIQWMIADSMLELESIKWIVLHAAWQADQGQDPRLGLSMA